MDPASMTRGPGRPRALTPTEEAEVRERAAQGASLSKLAGIYGVGRTTIRRTLARSEA
ncbi:helix-turn-helix domain-containing protein [Microbacterium lushaniae]|nr:helix-turn-helix domain-containing protein [Microbacterium lushaniae]